jgi:hypothetical protein
MINGKLFALVAIFLAMDVINGDPPMNTIYSFGTLLYLPVEY